MHAKCTTPRLKIQTFSGDGAQPTPQTLPPIGEGNTPPQTSPPRRLQRLDTRAFGARPGTQTKVLDPPYSPCNTVSVAKRQSSVSRYRVIDQLVRPTPRIAITFRRINPNPVTPEHATGSWLRFNRFLRCLLVLT